MTKPTPAPRRKIKKKIIIESLIAFIIVMTPFLLYSYIYFPDHNEEQVLFGYEVPTFGFSSLSVLAWYILVKTVPLYLLVIWFFTCKHWWYHVLIIPIAMYAFQLLTLFINFDTPALDTEEIIWILPVCVIIIPFVYLIRVKLYDKHVLGIDLEQIEADIQEMESRKEEREKKLKEIEAKKK